jgi:Zn-dependent peptidase ImmA (M78 family)
MTIFSNKQWSGAAIPTDSMLNGPAGLIIINDLQSLRRQRATLMEEICHLLLGHQPSRIDQNGRTYNRAVEEEAYAVGAATLLPYKPLRELIQSRQPIRAIARHFEVSIQLVNYRSRVLGIEGLVPPY